ncbi:GNAT family N-acetyltransferase [Falsirhodobacter deserti]|uniref:GNAT family N-acetyltransferase n=1 Tax=Falsirhodobacter deserti TaxID=1365611 RepID=UPI000FE35467|nr:GNAT family N-acetyltransferase [Falsirhodobacter deserti]
MTTQTLAKPRLVPFTPAHLDDALRLSQQTGWPHRIEDWALTLFASDGVVAMDEGRVVGTALCAVMGQAAALSMIIVDQAMRGRGLGRMLMDAAMQRAAGHEMRLVATTDGLPLYEKLGFVATGQIMQHQGIALAGAPERAVRTGGPADVADMAALDHAASGLKREQILRRIAEGGEVLLTDGGFALLRPFGRGRVVGPIVARDDAAARSLLSDAATRCAGTFLRTDLRHEGLADLAASLGLARAGGGTAMVRDPQAAPLKGATTYALISQALG